MSASEDPMETLARNQEALPDNFPTPDEIQRIADAFVPIKFAADAGGNVGQLIGEAPGAGPKLAGSQLQAISDAASLISTSSNALLRSLQVYTLLQADAFVEVFPPPQMAAQQLQEDLAPLRELARAIEQQQG